VIYNAIGRLSRRTLIKITGIILSGFLALSLPLPGAAAEDVIDARPALWVIGNMPGAVGETYLLGSFHLLPKNYRWFEGALQTAYEKSDELVLEAEMTPEAMAEIQAMFIKNGFFAGDDNLKNHLDDNHYQKMLEHAARLMGQDEAAARRMKPWFMAIQLSIISIMSSGMDPNSGVDKYLEALAQRDGKNIAGLETPLQQMTALIDHPLKVQSAMLTDTLDKLDDFKSYITSYLEAWASGDLDKINKTMVEDMAKYPEMYQALLVRRNLNWLPKIERRMSDDKTTFIVVGAAHLVGDDGIIKLLRDKGYKIRKIQ